VSRAVARWFKASARDLPWRVQPRNPYLSLVSEFMLQQTQVARVLEKWQPFIRAFPEIDALAAAPEHQVLARWSGLGYYRRARNLHSAAREIMDRFGGRVPSEVADLQSLPGVGRYTAGAISSIAFDLPVPIVDGNVSRVLMRLAGQPFRTGSPEGSSWAWKRASAVVEAARASRLPIAAVNEGLMELGAMVCTPRRPRCSQCPLKAHCAAAKTGTPDTIPLAKKAPRRIAVFCEVVLVTTRRGVLLERRPEKGMWAGMWQAPTWERSDGRADARQVARWLGVRRVHHADGFTHQTTHRTVNFRVWRADSPPPGRGRVFVAKHRIAGLALSNAQRRILLGSF
jgi:A/G-specific adenine glycosylase